MSAPEIKINWRCTTREAHEQYVICLRGRLHALCRLCNAYYKAIYRTSTMTIHIHMSLILNRGLPDASLPILASPLPPATAAKLMVVIISLLLIAASLYHVSPTRLRRVLSDAMQKLDQVFVEVSTAGLLGLLPPEDTQIVVSTYHMLRIKAGALQTAALRNSTSWRWGLFNFFACSTRLLRCIKQVKNFQRHLQILQEDHRNRTNSLALSFATATGVSQSTDVLTAE
ncbi:hypothetical protein B0H16DRAFT_1534264 [Mycena metata]|uniref:Uncharacterized protein n=1 Tax=Mycena metata TaxID=1033252 RepID=A0AAD7NGB5_9AGAR|nr:hypothetical protein B0H16DRAFT_1534264 [Mycena metata]